MLACHPACVPAALSTNKSRCLLVQHHHIATLRVVEGGHYPGLSIQVFSARAGDHHLIAEERALGVNNPLEFLQVLGGISVPLS